MQLLLINILPFEWKYGANVSSTGDESKSRVTYQIAYKCHNERAYMVSFRSTCGVARVTLGLQCVTFSLKLESNSDSGMRDIGVKLVHISHFLKMGGRAD